MRQADAKANCAFVDEVEITTALNLEYNRRKRWYDFILQKSYNGLSEEEIIQIALKEMQGEEYKNYMHAYLYYINHPDRCEEEKGTRPYEEFGTMYSVPMLNKIIEQKVGYLMSKEPTITPTEKNEAYFQMLTEVFDKRNISAMTDAYRNMLLYGTGWIYCRIGLDNNFEMISRDPKDVYPIWKDDTMSEVAACIYTYKQKVYSKERPDGEIVTKIEFHTPDGISFYEKSNDADGANIVPDRDAVNLYSSGSEDERGEQAYRNIQQNDGLSWNGKIPFIPLSYGDSSQTIFNQMKGMFDAINIVHQRGTNLAANAINQIIVVENAGGNREDEFYRGVNTYGVAFVMDNSDVRIIEGKANNSDVINTTDKLRDDIYNFASGIDIQNDIVGNTSGEALRFKQMDIDLDADFAEVKIQLMFEQLMEFVLQYLQEVKGGIPSKTDVTLVLNRNNIINTSQVIDDLVKSIGILPDEQITNEHPYANDGSWADLQKQKNGEEQEEQTEVNTEIVEVV